MGFMDRLRGLGKSRPGETPQKSGVGKDARSEEPVQEGPGHIDLDAVENILGYHFADRSLLILSLTHRSFTRFDPQHSPSNERLEFLGDSVLGLVISHQLFLDNPKVHEGELTKVKAMLVNEATLAAVAERIGINRHLRLSPEEDRSGGRMRPSIISDALESVIAAIFLDGGFDPARDAILRLIYEHRQSILSDASQRNCKGELLEMVQSWGQGMPRYEVLEESGPDHQKIFTVVVNVNGEIAGKGIGNSKKEAEQKAAAEAIETLERSRPKA